MSANSVSSRQLSSISATKEKLFLPEVELPLSQVEFTYLLCRSHVGMWLSLSLRAAYRTSMFLMRNVLVTIDTEHGTLRDGGSVCSLYLLVCLIVNLGE